MASAVVCACGGLPVGTAYSQCCEPALSMRSWPDTAHRLMRSRYTAHVLGDTEHLWRTWHPRTRPSTALIEPGITWLELVVTALRAGDLQDEEGSVSYSATYRLDDDATRTLTHREDAQFLRRARRWMFVGPVGAEAAKSRT